MLLVIGACYFFILKDKEEKRRTCSKKIHDYRQF